MSEHTIADVRKAMNRRAAGMPVEVVDEGAGMTRPAQTYRIAELGVVDTDDGKVFRLSIEPAGRP